MSDGEDFLSEKPRGQRRYLGREHNRMKETIYNQIKDRCYIQKTIKNANKKVRNQLINDSRDEFQPDIQYSTNKKNRWELTEVDLLKSAPINANSEVLERNVLNSYGWSRKENDVFALHSKVNMNPEDPEDFQIRRMFCAGSGQDYTSFLPKCRENQKKKKADKETEEFAEPRVSYNIYRLQRGRSAVGKSTFFPKASKNTKKQRGKKVDWNDFENDGFDENSESEEELELEREYGNNVDLMEFVKPDRSAKNLGITSSESSIDFEIVPRQFTELFNIKEYLKSNGFSFAETEIKIQNLDLQNEFNIISGHEKLKSKLLNEQQLYVDASEWCNIPGIPKYGFSMIVIFTEINKNCVKVLINSSIPSEPSKMGANQLHNQLSKCTSILEILENIAREFSGNSFLVRSMKMNCEYYKLKNFSEMLYSTEDWADQKNMTNISLPNKNSHESWAQCSILLAEGSSQDWQDVYDTVRKTCQVREADPASKNTWKCCAVCAEYNKTLVRIVDGSVKCRKCLQQEFYKEFSAQRLPIDLKIADIHPFDILPSIIHVSIFNLYIKMIYKLIYHGIEEEINFLGNFKECPSCKHLLYLEKNDLEDVKCFCGYSWCSKCEKDPHWPMSCQQYCEWAEQWRLCYALHNSQGDGNETLLEITCSCRRAVFWVKIGTEIASCPECGIEIDPCKMMSRHKDSYIPCSGRTRQRLFPSNDLKAIDTWRLKQYNPVMEIKIPINTICKLRKSVIRICAFARNLRLNDKYHSRVRNSDTRFWKEKLIEKGMLENSIFSSLYLIENVTGWMRIGNCFDRDIRKILELLMKQVENILTIEGELLQQSVDDMQSKICKIIRSVNKIKEGN